MLFAVKSPVDFFPQSFFFGGIVGIGHSLGKSGQFFARQLALARQFKSKVKHTRLFSARQLFDFFNDGCGGHGLIIAQIKFRTRGNIIPNRGQFRLDEFRENESRHSGGAIWRMRSRENQRLTPTSPQVSFANRILMNYWLVKSEPESYSWSDLLKEGRTTWTGIRNYQARNNLRAMKKNDPVFFYHSVSEKQIVGLASVARDGYPDPTAKEGDWVCVDLVPAKTLARPVALDEIKKESSLKDILLLRNSRLSVIPLTKPQFDRLLAMGGG
jgi:predicted RNA-binding protein with PUA-like domain